MVGVVSVAVGILLCALCVLWLVRTPLLGQEEGDQVRTRRRAPTDDAAASDDGADGDTDDDKADDDGADGHHVDGSSDNDGAYGHHHRAHGTSHNDGPHSDRHEYGSVDALWGVVCAPLLMDSVPSCATASLVLTFFPRARGAFDG